MRKPNGYGSINHLSGRRRRPFVFVVSKDGHQRPVAYFATQVEAEIFAADYNKIHRHQSLPGHQITLIELYHRWLPAHIADTGPSQSSLDGYRNAFRHLADLHYALKTEIITKAYAPLLSIGRNRPVRTHHTEQNRRRHTHHPHTSPHCTTHRSPHGLPR
jgi:integrase/recombinase XerD